MTAQVIELSRCPYPTNKETVRPLRIWDAKAKKHLRGRNYATTLNAHNAALILIRWEKVGAALEVYDIRIGRLIGQYARKPTSISFIKG